MRKLNIAMIGYGFMGRAHSNAWRQVRSFFDAPYEPVLKVLCGRNEVEVKKIADRFGWEEYATNWEDVVTRNDIDVVDVCSPGYTHAPIVIAAGLVILWREQRLRITRTAVAALAEVPE